MTLTGTLPLLVLAAAITLSAQTSPTILRLDPALDSLIAPGAQVEKVAGGFRFTEGPMWRQGRLWISDVVGDRIAAVSPDGKVEVLIDTAGGYPNPAPDAYLGPNAMVTDKDGTVLMAQQGGRTLVRISGKLQLEPFLDNFEGKKFNSPNDLVFASDGSLWFTDPPYGLEGRDQDPRKELPFNGVFRYAHGKLTPMVKDLTLPNGIGFSPDGRTLYVNNSGPEMRVMAYSVAPDGAVSNPRVLLAFPHPEGSGVPDGLKVDSLGNVWTTGPGGVRIVTPQGKVLGQIKLPETAANLAWAADGRTLYITAQTGVYRLHTLVAGEMPLYTR